MEVPSLISLCVRARARACGRARGQAALRGSWASLIALGVLAVTLWSVPAASAAVVSLVPNQDRGGNWSGTGCTAADSWQCIDEDASSLNDSDKLTPSMLSGGAAYEFTTFALGEGVVTSMKLWVRSTTFGFCSQTSTLRTTDGTSILSGDMGGTSVSLTSRSQTSTAASLRSLTQADIDGMYVDMGAPSCPWTFSAMWVEVTYATFSGTVDNTAICNGSTSVVGIAVNGAKHSVVPCDATTGAWRAFPTFAAGDTLTAYYDGVAGGAANAGATWAKAVSASPIGNVPVKRRQYRAEARAVGTPITNADMLKWDVTEDADIYLNASTSITVTDAGALLEAGVNTLQAVTAISTPMLWVRSGATLASNAAVNIDVTGSGTGTCTNAASARPWCIAGTFTPGTGSVTFTGTGTTSIPGGTYYHLRAIPPASSTSVFQLGSADATTINATLLTLDGTLGSPVSDTTAVSPTINVAGAVTVTGSMTLQGSGSGTITIGGDITGTGQVNLTGGIVDLRAAGAAQTINASGTLPGTPWRFATLRTSTSSGTRTVSVAATSRELAISQVLQAGRAADASTTVLDAAASTQPLTVLGSVDVTTRGTLRMPPLLVVHDDFTNRGSLVPGAGVLRFVGAPTSTIDDTGAGDPYDIEVKTPSKVIEYASASGFGHAFTTDAGSCTTPITIRSSVLNAQRLLANSGATFATKYTLVQDIAMSTPISVTDTDDLGGTSNIAFGPGTCGTIDTPYTHATNASSGSTTPTNISGGGAFHMSIRNNTGATADRFRTEVVTSPLNSAVTALLPFDGSGADRSATANPATASGGVSYAAGATNFGQAAQFNGTSGVLAAPSSAAYNSTAFTVELWMRSTNPGSGPATLVSRGNATRDQFRIDYLPSTGSLRASVTSNGGTTTNVTVPGVGLIDDSWHHIAMTADAGRNVRVYLDGTAAAATAAYPGTLDLPSEALRVGGQPARSSYFAGWIDDVQLSNYAKTPVEIAGYAATERPHAQSVWQTANHGGATGAALAPSCANTVRCVDAVYAGPDIHREGARYFVNQQLRTLGGMWSPTSTTWFETGDSIALSVASSVSLPTAGVGVDVTTSFPVVTTCTSSKGCALLLRGSSNSATLWGSGSDGVVPPITPASPAAPGPWAPLDPLGVGFTVLANSGSGSKDTARWGTGASFSNLGLLKFVGATRTPASLHTSSGVATETTTVGVRMNAPSWSRAGSYTGLVTFTAVANP